LAPTLDWVYTHRTSWGMGFGQAESLIN
jgi:hypothetical protein